MYDKNFLYVLTMLEAIEKISIYIKPYINAEEFFFADDQKSFNATVNLLIAIGEESKKIDADIRAGQSTVNWKLLAGLRDKVSHDYRGIDPEIIWSVARDELGLLKSSLIAVFKNLKIDKSYLTEILQTRYYSHLKFLLD